MAVKELERIELEKSISYLLEPGIIVNEFKPGAYLEAADLEACRDANLKIAHGKRYVLFMSFGYLTSTSKEARETAARSKFSPLNQGIAIMASSVGEQIVGNFYLSINKPNLRTRLFKKKEEAILWLKEILKQEQIVERDWIDG